MKLDIDPVAVRDWALTKGDDTYYDSRNTKCFFALYLLEEHYPIEPFVTDNEYTDMTGVDQSKHTIGDFPDIMLFTEDKRFEWHSIPSIVADALQKNRKEHNNSFKGVADYITKELEKLGPT